jgi:hypothetical protein
MAAQGVCRRRVGGRGGADSVCYNWIERRLYRRVGGCVQLLSWDGAGSGTLRTTPARDPTARVHDRAEARRASAAATWSLGLCAHAFVLIALCLLLPLGSAFVPGPPLMGSRGIAQLGRRIERGHIARNIGGAHERQPKEHLITRLLDDSGVAVDPFAWSFEGGDARARGGARGGDWLRTRAAGVLCATVLALTPAAAGAAPGERASILERAVGIERRVGDPPGRSAPGARHAAEGRALREMRPDAPCAEPQRAGAPVEAEAGAGMAGPRAIAGAGGVPEVEGRRAGNGVGWAGGGWCAGQAADAGPEGGAPASLQEAAAEARWAALALEAWDIVKAEFVDQPALAAGLAGADPEDLAALGLPRGAEPTWDEVRAAVAAQRVRSQAEAHGCIEAMLGLLGDQYCRFHRPTALARVVEGIDPPSARRGAPGLVLAPRWLAQIQLDPAEPCPRARVAFRPVLAVRRVLPRSPAERAGVRAADTVLALRGAPGAALALPAAAAAADALLDGPPASRVAVSLLQGPALQCGGAASLAESAPRPASAPASAPAPAPPPPRREFTHRSRRSLAQPQALPLAALQPLGPRPDAGRAGGWLGRALGLAPPAVESAADALGEEWAELPERRVELRREVAAAPSGICH